MVQPARGLGSLYIASHTSLLPLPSVSAIPVPRRPFSPANDVTAKLYSEFVWTESVPAPGGSGNRASCVETERIAASGIAISATGQRDAFPFEVIRHENCGSPSCRKP